MFVVFHLIHYLNEIKDKTKDKISNIKKILNNYIIPIKLGENFTNNELNVYNKNNINREKESLP